MSSALIRICAGLLVAALLFAGAASARQSGSGEVFTLWPIADYRSSAHLKYSSFNALGPLISYQKKGAEFEFALRPLLFWTGDRAGASYNEYLYPLAGRKKVPEQSYFHLFHLYQYDFGERQNGSKNELFFFPLIFYGQSPSQGDYLAVFPLGGKLYDKFGRDEIRFALFPLYGQTRRKGTLTTNVLWPIGARIRGENETGLKLWPLYGGSQKEGVYRKRYYLWPVFFNYRLNLDTSRPKHQRGAFPLYIAEDAPLVRSRTVLWPFFRYQSDREKKYEEWQFPWPLIRVSRGEYKQGNAILPFYADERVGDRRKRWFLWPLYKIEEIESDLLKLRRDRVLYFLYSHYRETVLEEGSSRKVRTSLWPLFTYKSVKGVSHFSTLSLLEPFFPNNQSIARNWSPLWRLYQKKWDKHGNEISSLLWNLYWKERRGDELAMEVFPLFSYQLRKENHLEFKFLKGLFGYSSDEGQRRLQLFFVPINIGAKATEPQD